MKAFSHLHATFTLGKRIFAFEQRLRSVKAFSRLEATFLLGKRIISIGWTLSLGKTLFAFIVGVFA